jgi:hypothetical protein
MQDPSVVQIAEWRFRKERRGYWAVGEKAKCEHHKLTLDPHGLTIRCDDCKLQLSAYWVLERMLATYRRLWDELRSAQERHQRRVMADIGLRAARDVEKAWRSRKMVPTCPHCHRGVFAADGFGSSMVSKEIELARRRKSQPEPHGARSADVLALYEEAEESDE